jgi:GxxExxY protein
MALVMPGSRCDAGVTPSVNMQDVDIDITREIIGGAIRVHSWLGPGLLEHAYRACLAQELVDSGLSVRVEVPVPIEYRGIRIDVGYRIDMLVNDQVLVELKAIAKVLPIHEAQTLSYLRLARLPVGLLINFNVLRLRDGIRRIVNQVPRSQSPPGSDAPAEAEN